MTKEFVCVMCPRGCRLRVDAESGAVAGNLCARGASYGLTEAADPVRVVTSTAAVRGGVYPRCPVKTSRPVPKAKMLAAVRALAGVVLEAPVREGDVVLRNVCGTGADFIATRGLAAAEKP